MFNNLLILGLFMRGDHMLRQLKKGFLLSVGLADLTREAAQKRIAKLVKDKHLTSKDGKVLLKSMLKNAKREEIRLAKRIDAETKRKVRSLVTVLHQAEKQMVQEGRAQALKTLEKVTQDLKKKSSKKSSPSSRSARGTKRRNVKNVKRRSRK